MIISNNTEGIFYAKIDYSNISVYLLLTASNQAECQVRQLLEKLSFHKD